MKKYSIRQSIMYDLKNWKEEQRIDDYAVVSWEDFKNLPDRVLGWQLNTGSAIEANNRLIAIVKWLNGEDVFEIGTPSYVVILKDIVPFYGKGYVQITAEGYVAITYYMEDATRFDDFKKASEWANKHFEVVEVDE